VDSSSKEAIRLCCGLIFGVEVAFYLLLLCVCLSLIGRLEAFGGSALRGDRYGRFAMRLCLLFPDFFGTCSSFICRLLRGVCECVRVCACLCVCVCLYVYMHTM